MSNQGIKVCWFIFVHRYDACSASKMFLFFEALLNSLDNKMDFHMATPKAAKII